jgi:hypothetical protein
LLASEFKDVAVTKIACHPKAWAASRAQLATALGCGRYSRN